MRGFTAFLFLLVTSFSGYTTPPKATETVVLGAGCFWCVEAVFEELQGVISVESGYAGGDTKYPTYKEVCSGTTGHAEVARIVYDPSVVTYETILAVFFQTHDPTTLNYQGNDYGTQYRSAIFYVNEYQRDVARQIISQLNNEGAYPNPIVTEVQPLTRFWPAENYHQDYYENNSDQGYCQYVIQPKLEKFRKVFKEHLK